MLAFLLMRRSVLLMCCSFDVWCCCRGLRGRWRDSGGGCAKDHVQLLDEIAIVLLSLPDSIHLPTIANGHHDRLFCQVDGAGWRERV